MNRVLWRMADHRFTKAHASEFLDGRLGHAERERVAHHASICPKCHALIASLRRVIETLPGLAAHPRPSVADGVLERLRREA